MLRLLRAARLLPLRFGLLTATFLIGVGCVTLTTRILVAGIDLQKAELPAGTYSIVIDRSVAGIPPHDRLSIIPADREIDVRLTYFEHEPSFTELSREHGDRQLVVWYRAREPRMLIVPFGTIHALSADGTALFDTVGTYLHRRRVGAWAGVLGMILLVVVVPVYARRILRVVGSRARDPVTKAA